MKDIAYPPSKITLPLGLTNNYVINFQSVKESCHGEYVRVDPKNVQCLIDLEAVNEVRIITSYFHIQ